MIPVRYAGHSDAGRRRPRNEDRWGADPGQRLYMVADGVATSTSGGLAAQLVIDLLPEYVARYLAAHELDDRDATAPLGRAVGQLSDDLYARGHTDNQVAGSGTTVVAVMVTAAEAMVTHLGDSRAYLYRDHEVAQLTRDHTLVQTLIDAHGFAGADSPGNPARGVLTQYVMMEPPAQPDVRRVDLLPRDRILLSTDGLHGVIDDAGLAAVLGRYPDPGTTCRALVDAANSGGGPDNVTAVVIDIQPDPA